MAARLRRYCAENFPALIVGTVRVVRVRVRTVAAWLRFRRPHPRRRRNPLRPAPSSRVVGKPVHLRHREAHASTTAHSAISLSTHAIALPAHHPPKGGGAEATSVAVLRAWNGLCASVGRAMAGGWHAGWRVRVLWRVWGGSGRLSVAARFMGFPERRDAVRWCRPRRPPHRVPPYLPRRVRVGVGPENYAVFLAVRSRSARQSTRFARQCTRFPTRKRRRQVLTFPADFGGHPVQSGPGRHA